MLVNVSTARAFWAEPPTSGVIREHRIAAPGDNEVLVETIYSAISRGTESLVHQGRVPESQHNAMRAPFQDGQFPGPVKYGYMNVGKVISGPASLVGRNVFCLYPHQTAYVVPHDMVVEIPANVPVSRAVLAANMETALNALWDGNVQRNHRVAVIGAGVVGCLAAYLVARIAGATVELIDIDPAKSGIAEALGVDFNVPGATGRDFDRVFHASASEAGLQTALQIAGFEAEIIELSWFGDRTVGLPLGEQFHSRRLVMRSSQVGHVAPAYRESWTLRDRLIHAVSLLSDPALDVLITGESRFDDLTEVMKNLIKNPEGVLCHRIAYDSVAP